VQAIEMICGLAQRTPRRGEKAEHQAGYFKSEGYTHYLQRIENAKLSLFLNFP
jgi:hypothetical protein